MKFSGNPDLIEISRESVMTVSEKLDLQYYQQFFLIMYILENFNDIVLKCIRFKY